MIQFLPCEMQQDGSVVCKCNLEQIGSVMGVKGSRIKEVRRMSGAEILIEELQGDSCMRNIIIKPGEFSTEVSVENAAWLLNICVNAFCDPKASIVPFNTTCTL